MNMNILSLKMKLKSLAEESRIIRKQERKMRGQIWGPKGEALYLHRIRVVRVEARATLLAYGYLRGQTYAQVEAHSRDLVPPPSVIIRAKSMVSRYGTGTNTERDNFGQWLERRNMVGYTDQAA